MPSWEDRTVNLKNIYKVGNYIVGSRFNDEGMCCKQCGCKGRGSELDLGHQGRVLKKGDADQKS